jgi:hypothetical protein
MAEISYFDFDLKKLHYGLAIRSVRKLAGENGIRPS